MSDQMPHPEYVPIYLDRCDDALKQIERSVEKLESYSARCNEKFFSVPLEAARNLFKMVVEIQNELYSEIVDFGTLTRKGDALKHYQASRFNPMGKAADYTLYPRGFVRANLVALYILWSKIRIRSPEYTPYVPERSNLKLCHKMFMEVFEVNEINIFGHVTRFEMRGEYIHRDFMDPPIIWAYPPETLDLNGSSAKGDSRSASPALTEDEDDAELCDIAYKVPEEGEFDEFELKLLELMR